MASHAGCLGGNATTLQALLALLVLGLRDASAIVARRDASPTPNSRHRQRVFRRMWPPRAARQISLTSTRLSAAFIGPIIFALMQRIIVDSILQYSIPPCHSDDGVVEPLQCWVTICVSLEPTRPYLVQSLCSPIAIDRFVFSKRAVVWHRRRCV